MYGDIPDNYDLFEMHEAEQGRLERMRDRLAYIYGELERGEGEDEHII